MKKKVKSTIKLAHIHLTSNICAKAPVSGTALYYVRSFKDGEYVMLLHPITLDCFKISRRALWNNVTEVFIPKPLITARDALKCNRMAVGEHMQERLRQATEQARVPEKTYNFIRSAIADLKQVSINDIPDYRVKTFDWQKRIDSHLKTVEKEPKWKLEVDKVLKGK